MPAKVVYKAILAPIVWWMGGRNYILDAGRISGMPTHGSLTKAGKVRGQTPKIQGKPRASPVSKLRNKNNFIKRFEKRRPPGQKRLERGGRR